jgi:aminomethyltransferase
MPSPLSNATAALGARTVGFAGWELPLQFSGVLQEHRAVREGCGVFDISHMGQIEVRGPDAACWLDGLLTNRVAALGHGQGQYSLLCNEGGGVIDDLIAYRTGDDAYFLVVNAATHQQDLAWLQNRRTAGVELGDRSLSSAAMAVQGPLSAQVWAAAAPGAGPLPPRNGIREFAPLTRVCRTGYTGEDGFEIFCPVADGPDWFRRFVAAGAEPCGLGARDILRLEMGYPLNGSDLTPRHTPLEAGLGRFVDLGKDFVGATALRAQAASGGPAVRLAAFKMDAKGAPPRHGYPVLHGGQRVGEVTSGGHSPSLGTGIGLAYLPAALARPGTGISIEIRGNPLPASVVKKPIYTRAR